MEARPRDDACVGEVEVLKVPPVMRMTVCATRLNPRTVRQATGNQRGCVPQFPPQTNGVCIRQWCNPTFRRILHKSPGGSSLLPSALKKFQANTRKPLASPSVRLNRKRTTLAPAPTVLFAKGTVNTTVRKPPPMLPKLRAGSATVTLPFSRRIHGLSFTWTLACSEYRSPCTCSQRDRTDSLCPSRSVTVWVTVVPSAPMISIGSISRLEAASLDPP